MARQFFYNKSLGPPLFFSFFFGPLLKKFAHHCCITFFLENLYETLFWLFKSSGMWRVPTLRGIVVSSPSRSKIRSRLFHPEDGSIPGASTLQYRRCERLISCEIWFLFIPWFPIELFHNSVFRRPAVYKNTLFTDRQALIV